MITKNIQEAVTVLEQDDVVVIPTETVYGLAGNIFSNKAIKKIFEVKNRPFYNPLIVHIDSVEKLPIYAKEIPEKALQLAHKFWPGSLTLVLKKQESVPYLITSNQETVAIRVPNHKLTLELLKKLSFPLAAPSANPFGSISPTTAEHAFDYFKNKIKVVLDGGSCRNGIESTIIGFEGNEPILYRLGSLTVEEIEAEIGTIRIQNASKKIPVSPGMLSKHYAPKTPLILTNNLEKIIDKNHSKKIGLLVFTNKPIYAKNFYQEVLSQKYDLKEAASNLYAALHNLDKMNFDLIIAEKFEDKNLGKSINDRLLRASKNS